jgi:hypothetical protein
LLKKFFIDLYSPVIIAFAGNPVEKQPFEIWKDDLVLCHFYVLRKTTQQQKFYPFLKGFSKFRPDDKKNHYPGKSDPD